jgi:hypothetical protein
MRIAKIKIANVSQDQLIAYLTESILFDYLNITAETAILASEEFYLRTNSDQLNVIIIRASDAALYVDIIGGGGGTGLFSITWGSEDAFVKRTLHMLKDCCKTFGSSIEMLE